MATILQDTQLMDNYIASGPVPAVQEIAGIYDENHFPMLFHIDANDHSLYLVYRDPTTGQNKDRINLSTILGLKGNVVHLQAAQSQSLLIYLVLATATGDANKTELIVFKPTSPQDFKQNLTGVLTPPEPILLDPAYILMSPIANDNDMVYPHIAVITNDRNVHQVVTNVFAGSWTWATQWGFPADPAQIVDLAFAVVENLPSIWVLENDPVQGQDTFSLTSYANSHGGIHTRTATIPPGTTSSSALSVLVNDAGAQDLLLLGNGLHHFKNTDFSIDGAVAIQLSNHFLFNRVGQATIHQDGPNIRLWFSSHSTGFKADASSGTMSYCPLSWTILQNSTLQDLQVTPFTSNHQVGRYSALVAPDALNIPSGHAQVFMYVDTSGHVQIATQSATGLWAAAPSHFSIPAVQQMMTLQTYTTNIKVSEAANASANHKVTITSSDLASPFINGIKYNLRATAGSSAEIDIMPNSNLVIIQETTDLTVPKLSLQIDELPLVTLDQVTQIKDKLFQLNTVQALKEGKVKDKAGNVVPLLEGSPATESQILRAANSFEGLRLQASNIPQPQSANNSQQLNFSAQNISQVQIVEGLFDFVDPLWHWVCHTADSVVNWPSTTQIMEEIEVVFENGASVFIQIQTFADIARAGWTILFQELGLDWDRIKAWLGVSFEWEEIIGQQRLISSQLTRAVSYGQAVFDGALDAFIDRIDFFMENLEAQLTSLDILSQGTNDQFAAHLASPDEGSADENVFRNSSKGSVILNALFYGNVSGYQEPRMVAPNAQSANPVQNILNNSSQWLNSDRLSAIWNDVQAQLNKPAGATPFIQILKDFTALLLELVRIVVDDVLKLVELVGDTMFEAFIAPIEVPVLGPLLQWVYELVTGNQLEMPSVIDILSFIFATVVVESGALSRGALDYEVVDCLPPQSNMVVAVKDWITGSEINIASPKNVLSNPEPRNPRQSLPELAVEVGVEPLTPEELSRDWMRYSKACAGVHPLTLLAQAIVGCPLGYFRYIIESIGTGKTTGGLNTSIGLLEKFDFAFALLDLAFACPPNEARPDIGFMYAGYGIEGLGALIAGLGGCFSVGEGKNAALVLASIEAATVIVKVGLFAKSLDAQRNEANMTAWVHKDQREIDDLNLAIGDLVCSGVKAIGKWLVCLGVRQGNEDVIAFGAGLNILSAFADFAVDETRGAMEIREAKGAYAPVCK